MKKRKLIYVNANHETHEFIYTGIEFCEFVKYLQSPMENILLLKSNYIGNNFSNNFELAEGLREIETLAKANIYNCGNFCFVDYTQPGDIDNLSDAEIAEILYLAHLYKPLKSPFYKVLNNRFAYLAHDDGFFCKLYCQNSDDFLDILDGKIVELTKAIAKRSIQNLSRSLKKDLLRFAGDGMLLDLEDLEMNDDEILINIYIIGKHGDMDKVFNERQSFKENSLSQHCMKYKTDKWHLV